MSDVERVVIPPAAKPDQTEAEKAAIERAKLGTDTPPAPEGAGLILGKFKTHADLEAAYKELERKLGAPKEPEKTDAEKAAAEAAAKAAEAKPEGDLAIKPADADPDAKFKVFEDEFAKEGKLSDASYDALQKMGIPRRVVDSHIASMQGSKENYTRLAHDAAGGADKFTAMQTWAASNADAATVNVLNDLICSGDPAKLREGITLLKSKYDAATGSEPNLIDGAQKTAATAGFLNIREMSAAQRDPRYGKDPRYMAEFNAKVAAMK